MSNMPGAPDDNSLALAFLAVAERTRARRMLRRIQMKRLASAKAAAASDAAVLPLSEEEEGRSVPAAPAASIVLALPVLAVPLVGAVSLAGRQRKMEDAVTVWSNLCSPMINRRLPVHFYAVFDGHGGSHFAKMCKQKMHLILKQKLMGVPAGDTQIGASSESKQPPGYITDESALQETWSSLLVDVFKTAEAVAMRTCSCGIEGLTCSCNKRFLSHSGTTAVAVVVTEKHIVVGNCGDSRAVLYRSREPFPLSEDHKPDRADEKARIEASGGHVLYTDTYRVEGVLAMSRAIGDHLLKPSVISDAEVSFTRREADDEFIIIASDGLWDVMNPATAGEIARSYLIREAEGEEPSMPAGFSSRSLEAASMLARYALFKDTCDNVSVIVVDLATRPAV